MVGSIDRDGGGCPLSLEVAPLLHERRRNPRIQTVVLVRAVPMKQVCFV